MLQNRSLDWPFDPPFVLLEDRVGPPAGGRLFVDPVGEIRADRIEEVAPALEALRRATASGLFAAGFIGYEAWAALEPRIAAASRGADRTIEPLLWFGLFPEARTPSAADLDDMFAAIPPGAVTALAPAHDRGDHVRKVEAALRLIEAGDIYQVNLTFPIDFHHDGAPAGLYAALRAAQPVRHGALVATADWSVLSVSPELFVRVRGGAAEVRPMKGTAARGTGAAADAAAAERLALDPKQRAENLMIVDLLRNDLSRVCRPGSVRTPHLWTVERYPTFHALTSTVTGTLSPGVGPLEALAALFPCGSVVGAPKIRAGEIIGRLEERRRGVYTGAIGAIAPDGDLAFNVAIRTAVLGPDGRGLYAVGGGVVADSSPGDEYDEALLKARVLTDLAEDFHLIETLLWSPELGYVRLDRHRSRLKQSAAALGFAFDDRALDAVLARLAPEPGVAQRVRITLSRDGRLDLTRAAAAAPAHASSGPARIGVFEGGLDPGDPLLRHKTSRRGIYDAAWAAAEASGLDEMVILNRNGAPADCARHSLFVQVGDGPMLTPALRSGALAGVLRGALIDEGRAVEAEVSRSALHNTLYIGNSLRGLRPAILG